MEKTLPWQEQFLKWMYSHEGATAVKVPSGQEQACRRVYVQNREGHFIQLLRGCFPVTALLLGRSIFCDLVHGYLQSNVCFSWDSSMVWQEFSMYCKQQGLKPLACDLVQFEAYILQVQHGQPCEVCIKNKWPRHGRLASGVRLLVTFYPVDAFRQYLLEGEDVSLSASKRAILIWKSQDSEVRVLTIADPDVIRYLCESREVKERKRPILPPFALSRTHMSDLCGIPWAKV
ncbi:MAG: hypothetical protein OXT67_06630 [Zetaproteobacteria bacterium]|nr:hypothetical protein [Zetaproteobacteria bacterium]